MADSVRRAFKKIKKHNVCESMEEKFAHESEPNSKTKLKRSLQKCIVRVIAVAAAAAGSKAPSMKWTSGGNAAGQAEEREG